VKNVPAVAGNIYYKHAKIMQIQSICSYSLESKYLANIESKTIAAIFGIRGNPVKKNANLEYKK
jgi:hypothetical protein